MYGRTLYPAIFVEWKEGGGEVKQRDNTKAIDNYKDQTY